jgi:drug/metabolite transporter (DMT)-like permease
MTCGVRGHADGGNLLGTILTLLSAATFAFNNVSVRRGVLSGTVVQAMAIAVPIGVPILLVIAVLFGQLGAVADFSWQATFWLALAGIDHFVVGRYCNYRATKAMGGNLAGLVQQLGIIISLGSALIFLDEYLTPLKVFGMILLFSGLYIALRSREPRGAGGKDGEPKKTQFTPDFSEGLLYSVLSGVAYGMSPLFIRLGLSYGGPGAGLAASLISYTAAGTVVVLFLLLQPSQLRHALAVDRGAARWFTSSGVSVCMSQMLRYMALSVAPITVVAPIQQTSVIFRIIFSWFINREHEVFDVRVVVGIIISLIGTVGISLGADVVLDHLPLPEWLVEFAHWQWP